MQIGALNCIVIVKHSDMFLRVQFPEQRDHDIRWCNLFSADRKKEKNSFSMCLFFLFSNAIICYCSLEVVYPPC